MNSILTKIDIIFLIISILLTESYFIILKKIKLKENEAKAAFIVYILSITSICLLYIFKGIEISGFSHLLIAIVSILFLISFIVFHVLKIDNKKVKMIFTFSLIFIVYLSYATYTPFFVRQHDSRNFYNPEAGGHFGYIGYIFSNNKLPNENPKDYWCFCNPPLFYIISTIVLKVVTSLKFDVDLGFELLQILSSIYAIVTVIYSYKILDKLKIRKNIISIILFIGLSPSLVIMSGSINNDMLSIMLSIIALYYAILWFNDEKLSYLITIALTIGLAMMTKISSALIAVIIAMIFLNKVINNIRLCENKKEMIKKYIIHFTIFAIISIPIGLWFQIKNYIKYDIPLTYVQSVDLDNSANISEYSIFDRFFKVEKSSFENVNSINMTKEKKEYNLYLTTIKSYLVDESIGNENNGFINALLIVMLHYAIYISILFSINIIYIIYSVLSKKIEDKWIYIFLLLFVLEIISYLKFCFDFPFTFTMNYRYIIPTLLCFGYFLGITSEKSNKMYIINKVSLNIFCVLSIIMFTNIL